MLCVYCLWYKINIQSVVWCLTPLEQYFSYIVAVSTSGGGNRSTRRNPPTAASYGLPQIKREYWLHWQTLSHNVVSSTPRYERSSNSQL